MIPDDPTSPAPRADDGIVTAGFLVIGDEILSGRTKDKNIGFLADALTAVGIDLTEVRIVPDDTDRIVEALNALRARWTHVFTSGGIGPTHDDITSDAIAAAFGVGIDHDPRAVAILTARLAGRAEINEARLRMARIPFGADLIVPANGMPGFTLGNVHVMAGVPSVFQAMVEQVVPTLGGGRPMLSRSIDAKVGEGTIATPLGAIQKAHPATVIGSYPYERDGRYATNLVVRSRSQEALDAAHAAIEAMLADIHSHMPAR
ncbi:competence/damage-inducible protein A [Siculibacillus lacustris]|uniref:Competence/damage-inducible protein A n=1 Tax=Siculibacillus lacustris TaxID=1549641 RepID=A0A4Q9VFZ8_9HYPH|nr:molybdopterin-binding protein [Siculibacillus lacustris]TBW33885.1 competence/damage-inducible protein A [Siculibacillus lacustris]